MEAATSGDGTVIRIRMESGSSDGWSLTGHHRSAPSPKQLVAIHGAPAAVADQVKPPSHGGLGAMRGRPPYSSVTDAVSPGVRVAGSATHTLPARRSNAAGGPASPCRTASIARSGSRSSTSQSSGSTARAVTVSAPSMVLSDGSTRIASS